MPYNKPAPQWNAVGTEPPQSLKDNGWQFNQKPPADYFNWFFYKTAQAIIELQLEALNTEQKGAANGLATLGADSKLTASQLPAIGSGQITDNSITNTDLAADIKVGSLTTLTTTAKSTVVAAVNEVKSSNDAKIPNSEKGAASGVATLGSDSKLTPSQLPAIGSGQITDGSITNTDLATDVKIGSLTTLKTTNKGSVTTAVNEVHDEFDAHNGDSTKHITVQERLNWDAKATKALATQSENGLQSSIDKTKLDSVSTGANKTTNPATNGVIAIDGVNTTVYAHPTGDGNLHVPATGSTNNGKFLEAGPTAGSLSWANINWTDILGKPTTYAPTAHGHAIADVTGLQTALDGKSATSHTHADATTTLSGFFAAADKVKLNGISTGANKTTSSTTNGNIAIDGSQVTVYTHPATHPATMIVEDSGHRFVTDAEKNIWNAKASTVVATGSANGLMSAADFTKLAGVSTGANKTTNPAANGVIAIDGVNQTVYTHPTGDGNSHVPATGTTNAGRFLKAAGTANSASWQPMTIADIISLQAKLDEPQKFKLTEDNGFTKNITTADLNYVLESGFYYGSDLANNPSGTSAFHRVWVMMSEPTSGVQLCMSNVGRFHMRFLVGGSWSDWIVVFTPNNIQTGSVSITPSAANTPTGLQVTFPKPFRKAPIVQVTALTTGAVASVTAASVTTTGFFIYLSRSSVIPTNLGWTAVDTEL